MSACQSITKRMILAASGMASTQPIPPDDPILRSRSLDGLFQKLIESAAVGMALVGGSGRLAYANRAYTEMFGYDGDECIGLGIQDLVHGEDAAAAMEQLDELSRGESDSYRAERRFRRRD